MVSNGWVTPLRRSRALEVCIGSKAALPDDPKLVLSSLKCRHSGVSTEVSFGPIPLKKGLQ